MKTRSFLLLFFAAGLFCLGLAETVDPDLFWRLKTGELVVTRGIPHADTFSFTMTGRPFVDREWLSEVLLYRVNAWAGLPGLMIFFALLSMITFGFVYLTRAGLPLVGIPLTLLACYFTQSFWKARMQIFSMLMFAVWIWILQGVRNRKRSWKWLYALPILSVLWVNMNNGFLLGVGVMALVLACDAFQVWVLRFQSPNEGILRASEIKHLAAVFFLSVLGMLCNPEGFRGFIFPILMEILSFMTEWQWHIHDFHNSLSWGFLALLVTGMMSLLLFPKRMDLATALLYAGAMVAALVSRGYSPFFFVIGIPVIIELVSSGITSVRWRAFLSLNFGPGGARWVNYLLLPVLAGSILAGSFVWCRHKIFGNDSAIAKYFPVRAVKILKEKGLTKKRVFNEYAWGGYLIWNGFPVFIDGRKDIYDPKFVTDYLGIMSTKGWSPKTRAELDRWGIDYCLINSGSPLRTALVNGGEWQEVYREGITSMLTRKSSQASRTQSPEKT